MGAPEFGPIERKGRSSLVPFRLSMGSNISSNIATSEKAQRRSDLLKDFGTLNKESTLFKNSNLDFGAVLDFFNAPCSANGAGLARASMGSHFGS